MPPKPKKDLQPVQQEDFTQDVVLLTTVTGAHLQVGLLATAECLAPEPLPDAAAVPSMHLELLHGNVAPVISASAAMGPNFTLPVFLEQKYRHKKGPDIVDRLINSSVEICLCNSQTNVVVAKAAVDLLPFGLGSQEICDTALPLVPTATDEAVKVLPGSSISLSLKLMHQPCTSPPQSAASGISTASSAAVSAKAADAKAAAEAGAAAVPALEPFTPVSADEAAGCNVITFSPQLVCPLPPQMISAVHNANGALTCTVALHLPGNGQCPQLLTCGGGCLKGEQLTWTESRRAYLAPPAVQALKALLEMDQPLLLEVARNLTHQGVTTTDHTLADPAFNAYHALLQLSCAAEQLQEPGAVACSGWAVPAGCIAWAVQQGRVHAAGLPVNTPPSGTRVKAVEDSPPAVEGQPLPCAWQAAGCRFAVEIRLAKPLCAPWQPPSKPGKRLADVIAPRPTPSPAPAPTAADKFKAKVQDIAMELAHSFQAASNSQSGSSSCCKGPPVTAWQPQQQESLVFDLNSSGKYLAMKDQLKQLLLDLVQQRYHTSGSRPDVHQVQQLHSELYVHLMDELNKAIDNLTTQSAAAHSAAGRQQQQEHDVSSISRKVSRLLQLAAECELAGDIQRGHTLHQRRLVLLPTAEAWYHYGAFCMRVKACTRAQASFREALSTEQQHMAAAAALCCLGLCLAQGQDDCGGPDATVLEWVEVMGHSLKDAAGPQAALPWALLALLYRIQGKPKEAQARSCQQEVARQAKAALAGGNVVSSAGPLVDPLATDDSSTALIAANGYLAAAELCLLLKLPGLATQLLDLAAGIKDPANVLFRRMRLAAISAAQQFGDHTKALELLRDLSQHMADGNEEDKMLVLVMMGDVQYLAKNWTLAKQHYRRAMQRAPHLCSPRVHLCLGNCFMLTGDAAIANDVYTSCLESRAKEASAAAWLEPFALQPAEVAGDGTLAWLGLGQAHLRFCDYRECELALSEANLSDPEHPGVWGHLVLMCLQQGREADADKALTQALRHGLDNPELLVDLADQYQALARFNKASQLLHKLLSMGLDSVKVRCKLAAVLLAQHDYNGCQQHLAAAAQQDADAADKELLLSVLQKLQVTWPHL